MAYVKDLEMIDVVSSPLFFSIILQILTPRILKMYVRPLRNADPPIIPPERLDQFIQDVFHNFTELHAHHLRLVKKVLVNYYAFHGCLLTVPLSVLLSVLFADSHVWSLSSTKSN
jgi:hypothetical protein